MSLARSHALRWLFVVFVGVGGLLAGTGSAAAHAGLVSTSPANGTHTDESPSDLVLRLNEPVTLIDGSAQLIDGDGTRFDFSDVRLDDGGRTIVLIPAAPVPDGAFLATARVVSADTHVVSLSIQFTVGAVTQQGQFSDTSSQGFEQYLNYPSKAFTYLGLLLSAGLYLAARWVWPYATPNSRFRSVYRIGAGLATVGLLGRFAVLVVQQSGGVSTIAASSIGGLVATPHGAAMVGAVVLSVLSFVVPPRRTLSSDAIGFTQAAALVLAVTLGGHGGSAQGWPLSFFATAVHVYAISVWLGGVAMIFLVLRGAPELRRWHIVAGVHVALAILGGLVLAVLQVRPLAALITTSYGLLLVAKVVAVLAVIGLGYLTYRWFDRSGTDGRPRRMAVETAVAIVVVALTAVLSTSAPAKDVYTTDVATTLDFGSSEVLRVGIDSVRRGPQQLTVSYRPGTSTETPSVSVDLSSEAANVARLPVEMTGSGSQDGSLVWRSDRLIVPAPGQWKVTVRFDAGRGPKLASFFYDAL